MHISASQEACANTQADCNTSSNKSDISRKKNVDAVQIMVFLLAAYFHAANMYTTSFFAGSLAYTLQSFIILDYRILLALVPWVTITNIPCYRSNKSRLPFLWYASLFGSYYRAHNHRSIPKVVIPQPKQISLTK